MTDNGVTAALTFGGPCRRCVYVISFLLVFMAGSAARLLNPELKSKTRSGVMLRARRPYRGRRPPAALLSDRKVARLRLVVQRWVYAHARLVKSLKVLDDQRETGQAALGTGSLARSARWKALGGHGRNGPGARS